MKYAVLDNAQTRVKFIWPARWLARLHVRLRGGVIAPFSTRPADVLAQLAQAAHTRRQVAQLTEVLFYLVARDDDGNWATLRDADTPLGDEHAEIVTRALAV